MNKIVHKIKELVYLAKMDELYILLEYLYLYIPEEIIHLLENEVLEININNDFDEAQYNISRILIYLSINLNEKDFTKVLNAIISLSSVFMAENILDEFETIISKY